jgi:Protein of unknown function (DUF3251)
MNQSLKYLLLSSLIFNLNSCSNESYDGRINSLRTEIDSLKEEISDLKSNKDNPEKIVLGVADQGFTVLHCSLGALTFKIVNIVAIGNGSKVTLEIGNLANGDFYGIAFNASWTTSDSSSRSNNFNLVKTIKKGSWNKVEITLDNVAPQKFQYLWISDLSCSRVLLYRT